MINGSCGSSSWGLGRLEGTAFDHEVTSDSAVLAQIAPDKARRGWRAIAGTGGARNGPTCTVVPAVRLVAKLALRL